MASERVELARPFAVVDRVGEDLRMFHTEADARRKADEIGYTFVRLTAERVEEPIPEAAPSGWRWGVTRHTEHAAGVTLWHDLTRPGDPILRRSHVCYWAAGVTPDLSALGDRVPPCDHAHVAALLRREGVLDA